MDDKLSLASASASAISEYLNSLLEKAREIESDDPNKDDYNYENPVWMRLFNTVFSDEISGIIYKRFQDFDPYIPDTTYGADVRSFIREFDDYSKTCGDGFPTFEQWVNDIKDKSNC